MPGIMSEVRKFHQLIDEVDAGTRRNPADDDAVADASQFLEFLDITGKLKTYTPTEWQEAGAALGLTEDEINPWMEDGAAWIVDTSDADGNVAPAAWGRAVTKTSGRRNNPRSARGSCNVCIPDCSCGCVDCVVCDGCVYCGCCCIC